MSRFLVQDRSGFRQVPITRLMTIGRSSGNDLMLHAVFASRRHAWVWSQGDDVILEDLGSTYGTLVNGQTVRAPVFLNYGDVIHVGEARLTFVAERDPATSRTPPSLRVQDVPQPMAGEVPCTRCGAPNDPQAHFCANCGYPIDMHEDKAREQGGRRAVEVARPVQPITPLEPVVVRPFPVDSQAYTAASTRPRSDRRLWALILILAMLAVILVTIVAALLVIVLG